MTVAGAEPSPAEAAPRPGLAVVLREWGRIGCIGFGGPPTHIALLRDLCVRRRRWLADDDFEDAIAACNLLPGPASTQLSIYCAWRLRGVLGALVGGLAFILPGLAAILALSALFLAEAPPDWVLGAGAGAGAAVAAVAVHAGWSLIGPSRARAASMTRWLAYLVAGGIAAATVGPWLVLLLLGCGLLELGLQRAGRVAALLPLATASSGGLLAISWVALKVGALSYGGGFVIVPLMQADAVDRYHWLTDAQFVNAVALGQITPGPVVHTVAAVGYGAHGLGGGLLAAAVAFAPSFAFVLAGGRRFEAIRTDDRARAFLDGAGPAAVGAILGSAVPLAGALEEAWQYAVLAGAAVLLLLLRRGPVVTLLLSGAVGVAVALLGGPLPEAILLLVSEQVAAGWEALSRGAWEEALALVGGVDDDPEALEAAGHAHWWLDHADATLEARERAYRLYRAADDPAGAARVAGALAWDSLLFGGRPAVARGWLDRAARLLADEEPGPEHAWIAVREAEVALATGDPEEARIASERAVALAHALGRDDIEVVGRSLEGMALVHEGRVEQGMRRLDESAVAARAGDLDDLMWQSKVCCNLIAACERVGDVDRALQWCDEVREFARRWEFRTLFNVCRTQYAAVLLQTGAWKEAETELQRAIEVLSEGRRSALLDGTGRLGELRRRQGRLDEARKLFAQSEKTWVARVGAVELALDEDDPAGALALAERLERGTNGNLLLDRLGALALVTRSAVAAGRLDTAGDALRDLEELAAAIGTNGARGIAAHAAGAYAFARDDLEPARRLLEDAVDAFAAHEAPYERARARLVLARVLRKLGPASRAQAEARTAREEFRRLDARRDEEQAAQLLGRGSDGADGHSPLTRREREVLAFVAAGRSNREIATELVVSQHTVHRHVANILRKLGEPTRAAAAARAARDGLV